MKLFLLTVILIKAVNVQCLDKPKPPDLQITTGTEQPMTANLITHPKFSETEYILNSTHSKETQSKDFREEKHLDDVSKIVDGTDWGWILSALCPPCQNGGHCFTASYCSCPKGWKGKTCDQIDFIEYAKTYAPKLRFDSKQMEKNKCFPSSASDYHNARESGNTERICNSDYNSIKSGSVPTYYKAQECGGPHLYISYWVFYGYQGCCNSWGICQGSHELDWERVIVKVLNYKTNSIRRDAVQYYQHKGFYTKYPGNYEREGNHPIVYIGKNAHGSYHNQGGSNAYGHVGCAYYFDFRKPGSINMYMNTWLNLKDFMDESDPSFVKVMNSRHFSKIETPKQRNNNLCNLKGCKGRDITFMGKIKGCDKSDADENAGF